jgi:hypothetical protein
MAHLRPRFTLTCTTPEGPVNKPLTAAGVEKVGAMVARHADKEAAWDIAVTDDAGNDVTFDFDCFRN